MQGPKKKPVWITCPHCLPLVSLNLLLYGLRALFFLTDCYINALQAMPRQVAWLKVKHLQLVSALLICT